jgi:hypothetical protein
MNRLGLALSAGVIVTAGCSSGVTNEAPAGVTSAAVRGDSVACKGDVCVKGTVRHFELEGGFWAIRGDDNVTYDPVGGVPEAYRQEGLRVLLDARRRNDMGGIHMAGPIVEIISIQKLAQ